MELRTILSEPISGYWDGGQKRVFDWFIDRQYPDKTSRIGSWEGNYWFTVKTGKTEKSTLGNARRSLVKNKYFKNAIFEYIK